MLSLEHFSLKESTERGESNGASKRPNEGVEATPTQCQGSKHAKMGKKQKGKREMKIRGYNMRWGRKASDEM
jgi:hypothetical protein